MIKLNGKQKKYCAILGLLTVAVCIAKIGNLSIENFDFTRFKDIVDAKNTICLNIGFGLFIGQIMFLMEMMFTIFDKHIKSYDELMEFRNFITKACLDFKNTCNIQKQYLLKFSYDFDFLINKNWKYLTHAEREKILLLRHLIRDFYESDDAEQEKISEQIMKAVVDLRDML